MDYSDARLPIRLRGQIEATESTIRYLKTLAEIRNPGLRFGHADNLIDMEAKLTRLQGEADNLLGGSR